MLRWAVGGRAVPESAWTLIEDGERRAEAILDAIAYGWLGSHGAIS